MNRAAVLLLAAAASMHTQAAPGGTLQQRCTVGTVVVPECIAALRREAEYADEYLRRVQRNEATAALERERLKQARASCTARGITVGRPRIGMDATTALDCGWGRPSSVRRRTDASGTHEVWIYGGDRALSLTDNVVTVIDE